MYKRLYILDMTNLITISDARANLPSIIDKVGGGVDRFMITVNNKPMAVLLSVDELESIEETAEIMATPGAYENIMEGKKQAKKGQGVAWSDFKKKYNIR
jgi:prevent-host-death family protein